MKERLKTSERHESMRGYFAYYLLEAMAEDKDIWLITGDLGYGMMDSLQARYPERFINAGAAETNMMGVAVGLAMEGKKPFVYSITTFLLRRPYETLKLYVDEERVPVRLIGGGRDKDYSHDGPSHDSSDAKQLLATLPNIQQLWPKTKEEIQDMVKLMVESTEPVFISLRR